MQSAPRGSLLPELSRPFAMPLRLPQEHNPAVHTLAEACASAVVSGADADQVHSCFRNFFGWADWSDGPSGAQFLRVSGAPTEVGARRNVVFAPDKNLHEDLLAVDDVQRVTTYAGVNYGSLPTQPLTASPFPGPFLDYLSTVRVWPVTVTADGKPAAFVSWSGTVWTDPSAVGAMTADLDAFYSGMLQKLQAHFAKQ